MKKKMKLGVGIAIASMVLGGSLPLAEAASGPAGSMMNQIYVGDHLHTMSMLGHRVFMTGHQGAGMSDDAGKTWKAMSSLNGADVMSWTTASGVILAGGHNGLFTSTNNGASFKKMKFFGSTSDVHAIGASGKFVYLGSPQVGFMMSSDGGATWKMRNSKVGQNFMGTMLVDPKNPKRIIAPDMSAGLAISSDGGLTWSSLGGPGGPMAVTWNPKNIKEIAAIGMMSGGISTDAGKTWNALPLPTGAAAIDFSPDGKKIFVGVLVGSKAQLYTSINRGKNWQTTVAATLAKKVAAMDPNMPGMVHVQPVSENHPLALTLGTFGVGTSSVFVTAFLIRRKDQEKIATKKSALASRRAGA